VREEFVLKRKLIQNRKMDYQLHRFLNHLESKLMLLSHDIDELGKLDVI
jgi:hypothetical protein